MPNSISPFGCSVTRPELELPDLQLESAPDHRVISFGHGGITWERITAKSPFDHGEVLLRARRETMIRTLRLRLVAGNMSQLDGYLGDVIRSFAQSNYELNMIIGSESYQWECQPADMSISEQDSINKYFLMNYTYEMVLNIPTHPAPNLGSI